MPPRWFKLLPFKFWALNVLPRILLGDWDPCLLKGMGGGLWPFLYFRLFNEATVSFLKSRLTSIVVYFFSSALEDWLSRDVERNVFFKIESCLRRLGLDELSWLRSLLWVDYCLISLLVDLLKAVLVSPKLRLFFLAISALVYGSVDSFLKLAKGEILL